MWAPMGTMPTKWRRASDGNRAGATPGRAMPDGGTGDERTVGAKNFFRLYQPSVHPANPVHPLAPLTRTMRWNDWIDDVNTITLIGAAPTSDSRSPLSDDWIDHPMIASDRM